MHPTTLSELDQQLQADEAAYWNTVEEAALGHKLTTKQRSAIGAAGKTVGQFRDDVYARSAALADIKAAEESQRLRRDVLPRFAEVRAQAAGQVGLVQLFGKIIGDYLSKAVIQLDEVAQVQRAVADVQMRLASQPNRTVLPRRNREIQSLRNEVAILQREMIYCDPSDQNSVKAQLAAAERKYADALQKPPGFCTVAGVIEPPALRNFVIELADSLGVSEVLQALRASSGDHLATKVQEMQARLSEAQRRFDIPHEVADGGRGVSPRDSTPPDF